MYNIGIDVHKAKCVVAIKGEYPEVLKRTIFNNNAPGIGVVQHPNFLASKPRIKKGDTFINNKFIPRS